MRWRRKVVLSSSKNDLKPISECALGTTNEGKSVCSTLEGVNAMKKFVESHKENDTKEKLLQLSLKKAKLTSESELYQNEEFQQLLNHFSPTKNWKSFLQELFNPPGPAFTTKAISDGDQAQALQQWTKMATNASFHPIEFQLLNFMEDSEQHNALRDFDWKERLNQGYRTFAVLINTATFEDVKACVPGQSCGIHWTCMFFDFRNLSSSFSKDVIEDLAKPLPNGAVSTKSCTVEFFNSSGNPPSPFMQLYFQHVCRYFKTKLPQINLWVVSASLLRQQYSKTECGVWCLYYIFHRLQNVPFTWFLTTNIDDAVITQFRQVIFRHDRRITRSAAS
jgi:hypothetical protein